MSRYFPAWYLGTFPDRHVILASYEATLAASWGRKVRDTLEEWGYLFGVRVRDDVRAASGWEIEDHGGGMLTAGIGGALIGSGGHLIVVDDPVKNDEEAQSAHMRERLWDWYDTTLRTRLAPGGAIVLMMTRWHYDDLAGRLKHQSDVGCGDRWEELTFRALADGDDPLGRAEGEPLWPDQWPRELLLETKRSSRPETWEALYQQRPLRLEGGILRRSWFQFYQEAPESGTTFLTVDLATSLRETADYTVIASWRLGSDGRLYLLDLARARMEGPDIVPAIRRAAEAITASAVWIERTGFQLALVQEARRSGLPVRELHADRDKGSRAQFAAAWFEGGRVAFPRWAPWLPDLESELLAFPRGAHDDQVDAVCYGPLVAAGMVADASPPRLSFDRLAPREYLPHGLMELGKPIGW